MDKSDLRQVRQQLGWTIEQMATRLGVGVSTLNGMEGSRRDFSVGKRAAHSHAIQPWMPHAYAWLLLHGGVPADPFWNTSERLGRYKEQTGMTNEEIGAIFGLRHDNIGYMIRGEVATPKYLEFALPWVIFYGTRDMFAQPYKYEGVDYNGITVAPISLYQA